MAKSNKPAMEHPKADPNLIPVPILIREKPDPPKRNWIPALIPVVLVLMIVVAVTFWKNSQIRVVAELNGQLMENGETYPVLGGDVVTIHASSKKNQAEFISYCWGADEPIWHNGSKLEFAVPNQAAGETNTLSVTAGSSKRSSKTFTYSFDYSVVPEKELQVMINGEVVQSDTVLTVNPGDLVQMAAYPKEYVDCLYFKLGDETRQRVDQNTHEIIIPDDLSGETCTFLYNALYTDGLYHDNKTPDTTHSAQFTLDVEALCQVNLYVECNGVKFEDNHRYQVSPGDIITIEASSNEAIMSFISYYFAPDMEWEDRIKVYSNRAEIKVPYAEPGTVKNLLVEPVASNDDGSANTTTKTGWQKYTLEYINEVSMDITMDGVPLEPNGKYTVRGGETITVTAESTVSDIAFISYYFSSLEKDNMDNKIVVDGDTATFTVPEFSSDEVIILSVEPVAENDDGTDNTITKTGWMNYAFTYECQVNMQAFLGEELMIEGGVYEVKPGDKIVVEASSVSAPISFIGYYFGRDEVTDENNNKLTITVPSHGEGSIVSLRIEAVAGNDEGSANTITKTGWKCFYLVFSGTDPSIYGKTNILTLNGKKCVPDESIEVKAGDVIRLYATPSDAVDKLFFMFNDDEDWQSVEQSFYELVVPTGYQIGEELKLYVTAYYTDETFTDGSSTGETVDTYQFVIVE